VQRTVFGGRRRKPVVITYRFDRCEVRPAERQLLVDGQPVQIGARAFDLLLALIERRDRVVGKNELLDVVWPGLVVEENNLQVQVGALRKFLGQNAIATVPGRGYRITLQPLEDKASASPRLRRPTAGCRRISNHDCSLEAQTVMDPPGTAQHARLSRRACPDANCDGQHSLQRRLFSSCWPRCHGITGSPHRKPPTRPVLPLSAEPHRGSRLRSCHSRHPAAAWKKRSLPTA
jgi:DNA-binding winged helix-turn-helix (wHTH) protein